jgi:DNA-binding Lrp family transcriptional regulator
MKRKIDSLDLKLVSLLEQNLTPNFSEIAKILNTSPSTIFRRVKELQKMGVLKGYKVKVDYSMIGKRVLALVFLKLKDQNFVDEVKKIESIEELFVPLSDWDLIVKVRVGSTNELSELKQKFLNFASSIKIELISKEL